MSIVKMKRIRLIALAEERDALLEVYDGLEGEELKNAVQNSQWLQGSMTFTTSASGRVITPQATV